MCLLQKWDLGNEKTVLEEGRDALESHDERLASRGVLD